MKTFIIYCSFDFLCFIILLVVITWNYNYRQEVLYLQFKFVDADTIFIDSSCLLKYTKHINITYVKHEAKIHTILPIEFINFVRHIKNEKPNGQSHGNRNIYSKSSHILSQKQQKPVGSSQTSKSINVLIQAPVAN